MIGIIARKELRELVRDGRMRLVAALVVLLLLASMAFGWRQAAAVAAERDAAQAAADALWVDQGDKNPHVAAHYGKHVFKPSGALAFLDPGVDPYLGVTLELAAHQRTLPRDAAAGDASSLARFGTLSAATVLQLFVPLLIIALGFGAWSGERERGTLRQLAATGVRPRHLLVGKAIGVSGALALVLLPAAVAAGGVALALGEGVAWSRLAALLPGYLAYYAVIVAVTFVASARARSSRAALVALVGFWSVTCLVLPRLASDAAPRLAPLPSPDAFAAAVKRDLETGLPGAPREDRVEAHLGELLQREGFEGAENLMPDALLQGFELQAEAAFEDEVFDHHVEALLDAIARQERVSQWAAVLSPYLAIRALSSGLAGTDFAHHRAFQTDAEHYRQALVRALNEDFARNAGDEGWRYRAGRDLWARAPAFEHAPPDLGWALRRQQVALALLLAWLVLAWFAAGFTATRVKVVA